MYVVFMITLYKLQIFNNDSFFILIQSYGKIIILQLKMKKWISLDNGYTDIQV